MKMSYLSQSMDDLINLAQVPQHLSSFLRNVREVFHQHAQNVTQLKEKAQQCIQNQPARTYRYARSTVVGIEDKLIPDGLGGIKYQFADTGKMAVVRRMLAYKHMIEVADGTTYFRNFNANALTKLRRFRKAFDNIRLHTFSNTLSMYIAALKTTVDGPYYGEVMQRIADMADMLVEMTEGECAYLYCDDIVRNFYSDIDKITFVRCQSNPTTSFMFTNMHGLATLGGARGWTVESVNESINHWVSKEQVFNYENNPIVKHQLSLWMAQWTGSMKSANNCLSFEQFVTDPMRWATGGGSKKVELRLGADKIDARSKWLWALSKMSSGKDLYKEAQIEGNVARVALKEEVKTRTVITTPMASYLRQCYMLYRLGKPMFLQSTLVSKKYTSQILTNTKNQFICIDASRFDHTVSKAFVITLLQIIQDSVSTTDDLHDIMEQEITSIKNLVLEYDGKRIPYNNGLLSGWRITSLVGSLISALLCEYINKVTGYSMQYVVQGDDIIMAASSAVDKPLVLKCCSDFGIITNSKKTTIGRFGEFLKYRYGCGQVQGYALRSVRSIFYANPWLDTSVVTTPVEVVNKWYMLMSRIIVSSNSMISKGMAKAFWYKNMVDDVSSWLKGSVKKADLYQMISTPGSLGGLGVFENSNLVDFNTETQVIQLKTITPEYTDGDEKFYCMFGLITDRTKYASDMRSIEVKRMVIRPVTAKNKILRDLNTNKHDITRVVYNDSTNIFRSLIASIAKLKTVPPIVTLLGNNMTGEIQDLEKHIPRYLKKSNRWSELLAWLMGGDKAVMPPSLFVNNRYDSNSALQSVAIALFNNVRNITARYKVMLNIFAYSLFTDSSSVIHAL